MIRELLLATLGCVAAQAAALSGRVLDARGGEALARVRVQIAGQEKITDGAGRFHFGSLGAGKYVLHVETVGYRLLKRDLEIEEADVELEIALSPDSFQRTDSVEVRAGAFEPVAIASPSEQNLSSTEVKNLGTVLLDDPVRAVHSMPGVATRCCTRASATASTARHFRRSMTSGTR